MVEKSKISTFFGNEKALHGKTGEKALAEWKLHRGGSWHSECERREGETSAWLMGGHVEKHSSHSFGTPL